MSSPIFLDTGILIAQFSSGHYEEKIRQSTEEILKQNPHSSRHTVEPCYVELFYKLRKAVSPKDIETNLAHWGVTLFPVEPAKVLESFFLISHKAQFDFADYYLCCAALQLPKSIILTIDRDDFPLALYYAQKSKIFPEHHLAQLIPIN